MENRAGSGAPGRWCANAAWRPPALAAATWLGSWYGQIAYLQTDIFMLDLCGDAKLCRFGRSVDKASVATSLQLANLIRSRDAEKKLCGILAGNLRTLHHMLLAVQIEDGRPADLQR